MSFDTSSHHQNLTTLQRENQPAKLSPFPRNPSCQCRRWDKEGQSPAQRGCRTQRVFSALPLQSSLPSALTRESWVFSRKLRQTKAGFVGVSNSSRAQGQRVKHEGACCKLHKQEPNADLMAEEAGLGSCTAAGLAAAVPPAQTAASSPKTHRRGERGEEETPPSTRSYRSLLWEGNPQRTLPLGPARGLLLFALL